MKRLFSRRDKHQQLSQQPAPTSPPVVAVTPPTSNPSDSHDRNPKDNANNLLPLPPATMGVTRRKSNFFGSVSSRPTPTHQAHSDTSSQPLTGTSISGSSDASSSIGSTPIDETIVSVTPTASNGGSKAWSTLMSTLGKASIKKTKNPTSAPLTNVSRTSAPSRPSTSTVSTNAAYESSDTDDYGSNSDEDAQSSRGRIRTRRTIRAPGGSGSRNGGRQSTPQSGSRQKRSVFGGRAVPVPLSPLISKALANLHALTMDSLVPSTSAPPLVSTASVPFPRSSNRLLHILSTTSSSSSQTNSHSPLTIEMLRKRLLRRIERRQLLPAEQDSIQPLATRSAKPRNGASKRKLPSAEETYEESKAVGGGWSKGMKKWAMRPCFEERMVVYKRREDGSVGICPVERDARAAVAALEFSEGAEALAGLHRQNELPPPPADIYVPASNRTLPPPLVIPRTSSSSTAKPLTLLNSSTGRARLGPSRLRSPIDVSQLQTNTDEDDLPLGVVMLQKRQKDEAEERRKRVIAEKAERERKEEERKRRYKEEVEKARARREVEQRGVLAKKENDKWLSGDAEALPPPPKPFATHHKASSNPNLSATTTTTTIPTTGGLQVPVRPFAQRRMTSGGDSSASSSTSKPGEMVRQQSAPQVPSPWTGLPTTPNSRLNDLPPLPHSNSYPRMPMSANTVVVGVPVPIPVNIPHSAPPTQTGMNVNYGMMMMPPMPDAASLAMFDQNLLRPWANGGGSRNSSYERLTPPVLPFGFGSSGDSSGSLTPPRFPNSRPPSWGSSSEDVRLMMAGGQRPISIGSGSGESQDWRRSWLAPDDHHQPKRNSGSGGGGARNLSNSPVEKSPLGDRAVHQRMPTSMSMGKSGKSEKSEVPSSFSRHTVAAPTNRPLQTNLRSSSAKDLQHASSSTTLRSASQPRSKTIPLPSSGHPPVPPPKNPYGLPNSHSYGPSSGSNTLAAMNGITDGRPIVESASVGRTGKSGLASSFGLGSMSARQRPVHAHSKSSGPPQKKNRLFS